MTATAVKLEYEITPQALKALIDLEMDTVIILDIRDHAAYQMEHLPNACCVPLDNLEENAGYLPKDKLIVTYCGDGECGQALRAALDLAQRGFHVRHLLGGMKEWTRRGYPVVDSSQAW
jgi:rhodanese-related sulfurtransferase